MKKAILLGLILLLMPVIYAMGDEPIIYTTYSRSNTIQAFSAISGFEPRTRYNTATKECLYFQGEWSCKVSDKFCLTNGERKYITLSNSYCIEKDTINDKIVSILPVETKQNTVLQKIGFNDFITGDLTGIVPKTVDEQIQKALEEKGAQGKKLGEQCEGWTSCDQKPAIIEGNKNPSKAFRVKCNYMRTKGYSVCVLGIEGVVGTTICSLHSDCNKNEFCIMGSCVNQDVKATGDTYAETPETMKNAMQRIYSKTQCSDGTDLFKCSIEKPLYCDPNDLASNGDLVSNAQICGCKEGVPSNINPELCVADNNVAGKCKEGHKIETQCKDGSKVPLKICISGKYESVNSICEEENKQLASWIFPAIIIIGIIGIFFMFAKKRRR